MLSKIGNLQCQWVAGKRGARLGQDHVMVVLHGQGDSLKPFVNFNEEIGVPGLNLLLLNAPNPQGRGFSWYDDPPALDRQIQGLRVELLRVLITLESLGWPAEKVFLFGFSQGAFVASDFALHLGRSLGGVVGVSGYFNFYPRWRQKVRWSPTPFFMIHGTRDRILPAAETLFGVNKLRDMGFSVEWQTSARGHQMTEKEWEQVGRWLRSKCRVGTLRSVEAFDPEYPAVSPAWVDRWTWDALQTSGLAKSEGTAPRRQ